MSGLIDKTYINYLSSRLPKFKWVRGNVAVCSCPICGDGRKKKTRFYIYEDVKYSSYSYLVNCKNCGHSQSFYNFLKEFDSALFQQYRMEVFREKFGREPRDFFSDTKIEPKLGMNVPKQGIIKTNLGLEILPGSISVKDLPDGHSCKEYVRSRMIPEKLWDRLFYHENFQKLVTEFVNIEYAKKMPEDSRLLIPFYTAFGEIHCFQGRSLDPDSKMRYISVKKSDGVEKIFGSERVDRSKEVFVVEGPIDSLFIDNCLAAADADLLRVKGDVYIYDAQYRNRDVCRHIEKAIVAGVKLVLFPDDIIWKDINDMVVKGGMTQDDIKMLIKANRFSGLRAKMVFSKLKKY